MRALFFRSAVSNYMPDITVPFSTGVGAGYNTKIRSLESSYSLTGNKGNMIHRESISSLLKVDRNKSAYVNLFRLYNSCSNEEFSCYIKDNFDVVIFTMANFIRKGTGEEKLAKIVDLIDVPLYVFGVGLQDDLPRDANVLSHEAVRLLRLFNDKARIFGTRGKYTESWLHAIGCNNAVALGCPSMFVYPKNIVSSTPYKCNDKSKIITAGHFNPRLLSSDEENRSHYLMRLFEGREVSYVFQSELFSFKTLLNIDDCYDGASCTINSAAINKCVSSFCNIDNPFTKYYYFNSTDAWRLACSHYDLYIGDRIHGGVAAFQTGIPSIVLYQDLRVKEIAEYYKMPSMSIDKSLELGLNAAVEEVLNQGSIDKFINRYKVVYKKFYNIMVGEGFSFVNESDIKQAIFK
ncbi:polysaccharide pyruvyl transferase family protein [Cobetia amphilecti]|uniref:Polysaccharide pyruvyl transferase family protein n=1 Tax=Cobetia amphilecti TaxID=1055104 RepID=A0ABT6UT07_9GAMM|nr:polysaccharide pyruvyl transferase family protein [Cobetia amphilecti]MDI5885845.1 polysaccharide pyruvyl transferase family protein [Cobetia amphilecti]